MAGWVCIESVTGNACKGWSTYTGGDKSSYLLELKSRRGSQSISLLRNLCSNLSWVASSRRGGQSI